MRAAPESFLHVLCSVPCPFVGGSLKLNRYILVALVVFAQAGWGENKAQNNAIGKEASAKQLQEDLLRQQAAQQKALFAKARASELRGNAKALSDQAVALRTQKNQLEQEKKGSEQNIVTFGNNYAADVRNGWRAREKKSGFESNAVPKDEEKIIREEGMERFPKTFIPRTMGSELSKRFEFVRDVFAGNKPATIPSKVFKSDSRSVTFKDLVQETNNNFDHPDVSVDKTKLNENFNDDISNFSNQLAIAGNPNFSPTIEAFRPKIADPVATVIGGSLAGQGAKLAHLDALTIANQELNVDALAFARFDEATRLAPAAYDKIIPEQKKIEEALPKLAQLEKELAEADQKAKEAKALADQASREAAQAARDAANAGDGLPEDTQAANNGGGGAGGGGGGSGGGDGGNGNGGLGALGSSDPLETTQLALTPNLPQTPINIPLNKPTALAFENPSVTKGRGIQANFDPLKRARELVSTSLPGNPIVASTLSGNSSTPALANLGNGPVVDPTVNGTAGGVTYPSKGPSALPPSGDSITGGDGNEYLTEGKQRKSFADGGDNEGTGTPSLDETAPAFAAGTTSTESGPNSLVLAQLVKPKDTPPGVFGAAAAAIVQWRTATIEPGPSQKEPTRELASDKNLDAMLASPTL